METCLTIYVTFEGLGFCCFNPVRQGAEIALLRLPGHDLEITVTGSDGRRKAIKEIADNAKIELVSENTKVKGFHLNNSGNFDRKRGTDVPNDRFDLRWLLDCEGKELHGEKAAPKRNTGSVRDLTEMFLPNAYFYAEQVSAVNYEIKRNDEPVSKSFGSLGDALGARVDANSASLLIDGEDMFKFDDGVDRNVVTRFFVNIANTCKNPPLTPQSDFHKYYEVMDFPGELKFDFGIPNVEKRPRPAICEFVLLGKTQTLKGFFQN